jgi:hypothetical protein
VFAAVDRAKVKVAPTIAIDIASCHPGTIEKDLISDADRFGQSIGKEDGRGSWREKFKAVPS